MEDGNGFAEHPQLSWWEPPAGDYRNDPSFKALVRNLERAQLKSERGLRPREALNAPSHHWTLTRPLSSRDKPSGRSDQASGSTPGGREPRFSSKIERKEADCGKKARLE